MLFIDYKEITDLDFRITIPWIDGSDRKLYRKYGMLHTGVSIPAKRVYSYSQGVVVSCGVQADKYFITIQYDGYTLFRYCNLKSIGVSVGDIVDAGDRLGTVSGQFRFEYCTSKDESLFPVRIGDITYYKQNPELVFSGNVDLNANDWSAVEVNQYGYNDGYDLDDAMQDEFEIDNRDFGDGVGDGE